MVDGYLTALEASGGASLGGSANGSGGSGSGSSEELKLWTTFLHSQLLEARGLLGEALAAVERCVAMAPDTTARIDMLQRKARLLKRAGDVEGAAAAMDGARQLDLGDRYINNKTTKYLLRAGQVEAAQATIALFARHEGDPQHNLFEMQCMWCVFVGGRAGLWEGVDADCCCLPGPFDERRRITIDPPPLQNHHPTHQNTGTSWSGPAPWPPRRRPPRPARRWRCWGAR